MMASRGSKRKAGDSGHSQRFIPEYNKSFPCLTESRLSKLYAFCTVCDCDFSVAHGGKDDCRRHVNSKKHQDIGLLKQGTKSVSSYFIEKSDNRAIRAETYFARFLIEHNLPISAADHSKELFKNMFPDSEIAKKFSCGRTKCTAIIQSMAQTTRKEIVCKLNQPFSLATDGSNDQNDGKLYPVVVSYFENSVGKTISSLLSILQCDNNTGEGIFKVLDQEFKKRGMKWENCLAFSSDSANTMIGSHAGVASFILKENPSILIRRCSCHLVHLAAQKGAKQLASVNIEIFLIQVYYYLDKSCKRKKKLKLYQNMFHPDCKPHKILKYVSTRWLSLLDCINRVLEQWEPLTAFFCNETDKKELQNPKFQEIKCMFENPTTKLYLLFLSNILPIFTVANTRLQEDAPYIHKVRREIVGLFENLIVRFVKPSINISSSNIFNIDFSNKKLQKKNEDLVIGVKTRLHLEKYVTDAALQKDFYPEVRNIQDDFLKHSEVADVTLRSKVSFSSIIYLVKHFPNLVNESELDQLEGEFATYQSDKLDGIDENLRIDRVWFEISNLCDVSGCKKYTVLVKLMLAVLVVPHSNATSERIFSLVRKNQTSFRPNLSVDVLASLLTVKVNMLAKDEICFKKQFSESELTAAKSATSKMLAGQLID